MAEFSLQLQRITCSPAHIEHWRTGGQKLHTIKLEQQKGKEHRPWGPSMGRCWDGTSIKPIEELLQRLKSCSGYSSKITYTPFWTIQSHLYKTYWIQESVRI